MINNKSFPDISITSLHIIGMTKEEVKKFFSKKLKSYYKQLDNSYTFFTGFLNFYIPFNNMQDKLSEEAVRFTESLSASASHDTIYIAENNGICSVYAKWFFECAIPELLEKISKANKFVKVMVVSLNEPEHITFEMMGNFCASLYENKLQVTEYSEFFSGFFNIHDKELQQLNGVSFINYETAKTELKNILGEQYFMTVEEAKEKCEVFEFGKNNK